MKKLSAFSVLMLFAASSAFAQANMVVYTDDGIKTFPLSLKNPVSVDIQSQEGAPKFDQERKIFVVGDKNVTEGRVRPDEEESMAKKLEHYAIDMLLDYNQDKERNTLISPVSATSLFSMISNWAPEDVSEQLLSDMGLGEYTITQVNAYSKKLNDKIKKISEKNTEEAIFNVDNEMLISENGTVYNSLLSLADTYGVGVRGEKPSNIAKLCTKKKKVGEDAPKVKSGDNYLSETSSIINSDMDFQTGWLGSTKVIDYIDSFEDADGGFSDCQMIRLDTDVNNYRYGEYEHFDMVEIPYKAVNGAFSMYIVRPNEDCSVEESLLEIREMGLDNCIQKMETPTFDELDIELPMFKLEGITSLNPDNEAVSYDTKRLFASNMPNASPGMFRINDVSQKYFIQLDYNGTSANVKTEADVILPDAPQGGDPEHPGDDPGDPDYPKDPPSTDIYYFSVYRPFIVLIRETNENFIAYACCINNMKKCALFYEDGNILESK